MYYDPNVVNWPTTTADTTGEACYSKFMYDSTIGTTENYWKLGIPFYQTFEVTHDMDN
jgi:hypothetical protein